MFSLRLIAGDTRRFLSRGHWASKFWDRHLRLIARMSMYCPLRGSGILNGVSWTERTECRFK